MATQMCYDYLYKFAKHPAHHMAMNIHIRPGTIAEALTVETALPEFSATRAEIDYCQRMGDAPSLILVAEVDGALVGYKVGYAQSDTIFYSWLGGVLPAHRRLGLAQRLLEYQEQWVKEQNYRAIEVRSKNKFPGMLILLLKNGYKIVSVEANAPLDERKITFRKEIRPCAPTNFRSST
ncbi:MAG: GNAT family N-acetyltransferase [Caldilineaceae bacterium]|nr:GNAT family N-acetyltransferase [Caldilineaceae bacterium]MCB0095739.1 GNAT family N-acetyltransferase [Caldilineaceae bacterium]MCB0145442.1 GNAT family N-acetyltransferase [Caldilineaceae bacterium]